MYNIEVTIREGGVVWRQRASVREGQFNGSPYYLFDDLFMALNEFRNPICFTDYTRKFFDKHINNFEKILNKRLMKRTKS